MAITYSAFAKRVCNHFHEAQGCCSSPEAHEICGVKKKTPRHRPLPGLRLSLLLPASFTKPAPPPSAPTHCPPGLPWPTCDHAESESYCVVDNLLTAAVHLMYRCGVRWGVSSGRRISPAPSAQRKEKCQLANLEKESYLYEDTLIIPQNKWDFSRYTIGGGTMDSGFAWMKNGTVLPCPRKSNLRIKRQTEVTLIEFSVIGC